MVPSGKVRVVLILPSIFEINVHVNHQRGINGAFDLSTNQESPVRHLVFLLGLTGRYYHRGIIEDIQGIGINNVCCFLIHSRKVTTDDEIILLCLYRQSDDGKEDGGEGMFHNHMDSNEFSMKPEGEERIVNGVYPLVFCNQVFV